MKCSPAIKASIVVIILGLLLYAGWMRYSDFLSQGQRPPESAEKLNTIESQGLPDFELNDLSGNPVRLKQFAGKIVILNFWASWCDPCIAEFPSLLKLVERNKGQVVLLAVSADYERADIDHFLKIFKIESPYVHIVWDKDLDLAKKLGTFKLPESYIVGKEGQLIRKVAGVDDWATPDAFQYFDELVAK